MIFLKENNIWYHNHDNLIQIFRNNNYIFIIKMSILDFIDDDDKTDTITNFTDDSSIIPKYKIIKVKKL